MPAVRIEEEAFGDDRYEDLAIAVGLPDADCARGKMARLWRQCTIEQTHTLPNQMVLRVLGPRAIDGLEFARLGERVGDSHVRIRGTKGRIEWLKRLRDNGRKGGRPNKNQKKPSGSGSADPSGSENQNPSATASSTAPASASSRSENKKKPRRQKVPPDWTPSGNPLTPWQSEQLALFRNHHRSKGTLFEDVEPAWANWLMRAGRQTPTANRPPPPTVRVGRVEPSTQNHETDGPL